MSATVWQLSGYTPVRRLGAGASGSVMLATHDETGTPVAIKYLIKSIGEDPSFRTAFREEARLLGEIDDPHVSRLYEYVESPDGAAIVMELVNGVSLRQMLRAHGPTTPESALCVLKGSLAGLAAAHDRGVVHRDYKPENVLVTGVGLSKLADFGIAMPIGQGSDTTVSGTPRYMAPEQWTGAPASPACDIYAATATFFECLTGRPPYEGRDLLTLRQQHATAPLPTDPAPVPVHDLLRQGMAKQPADRPQPAQVFIAVLEAVAAGAYGDDWEERGLRELARRAALLAALFPFPDGSGGATSLASTVLGEAAGMRRSVFRQGRRRTALAGGALVAALLVGGAGFSYASRDEPAAADGPPVPAGVGTPAATASPTATPTPAATTPAAATPTPSATAFPSATLSRSRSAAPTRSPVRTSAPAPSPTTSTSPPPPPDVTAPSVAGVSAYPTQLEPRGCLYGAKTSTISATASDDRSRPDALRVSFRYTLAGSTSSVGMTSIGQGGFQGTLGPLPAPKDSTRIPIYVTAVDAAGNSTTSASPIYVTLYNYCTPG